MEMYPKSNRIDIRESAERTHCDDQWWLLWRRQACLVPRIEKCMLNRILKTVAAENRNVSSFENGGGVEFICDGWLGDELIN